MTGPTSRQRGRPPPPKNDKAVTLKKNLWSKVPDWARHQDILTDWPSVAMWLWFWLSLPEIEPQPSRPKPVAIKYNLELWAGNFFYSELLCFWTLPNVRKRFGNWICFSPQVKRETPTLLGPLERANFNHWIRVIPSIIHHRQNPLGVLLLTISVSETRCLFDILSRYLLIFTLLLWVTGFPTTVFVATR
jgi:hypothetical protein